MIRKNILEIPTELIHNNSVFRKSLVKISELNGEIQTINYAWLNKNMSFEPHIHTDSVECFLILQGNGKFFINKEEIKIKKNDFIIVEKGEEHYALNSSSKKLTFLTIRVLEKI